MKVLFLADGNSAHTKNWVNLLTKHGIDIFLFSLTSFDKSNYRNNKFVDVKFDLNDTNTDDSDFSKIKYLSALRLLRKTIKKFNPDILHAHYATSYGLLGVLTRFRPLVISVWGSDVYFFPKKSILHKCLLKFNLKFADYILSTSEAMASETKLYTKKTIEITPFGVDIDLFKPKKVESLFEKNSIVIGTVKSLDEVYGIEYLIRAFHILKKKYSNINLLLIGGASRSNTDYSDYLKNLVHELNIEKSTIFTGRVSHELVSDYHNMLSVPVYVSLRESFGVSVIESQSCGKAVIVSNVGGLPEVIKSNETGFLVNSGDEDATAMAIERLILDEELRLLMGKNARKWVIENFSQEIVAQRMITIYQNILKEIPAINK